MLDPPGRRQRHSDPLPARPAEGPSTAFPSPCSCPLAIRVTQICSGGDRWGLREELPPRHDSPLASASWTLPPRPGAYRGSHLHGWRSCGHLPGTTASPSWVRAGWPMTLPLGQQLGEPVLAELPHSPDRRLLTSRAVPSLLHGRLLMMQEWPPSPAPAARVAALAGKSCPQERASVTPRRPRKLGGAVGVALGWPGVLLCCFLQVLR